MTKSGSFARIRAIISINILGIEARRIRNGFTFLAPSRLLTFATFLAPSRLLTFATIEMLHQTFRE
jgi:hypothetical protein